jgi:diketogulonate reductase-like aldo/keto reductase
VAGGIPTVRGRGGFTAPALGLGTWRMGEDTRRRSAEVAALRLGHDLGMTLVDTAEMYGDGGAEELVGEAIRGRRDEVFLVSKVQPHNASREGTIRACERSLERLGTDRIDLYLLHWPGSHPLEVTFAAFRRLVAEGKILHYGVSNFDTDEMEAAAGLSGCDGVAANQVLYNLERRGVERRLLPWCSRHGVLVMAYSPLEQGRLRRREALQRVARRHGVTPLQAALAWTLRTEGVIAIPKAADPRHIRENAEAVRVILTEEDLHELDRAYPIPARDVPLEML